MSINNLTKAQLQKKRRIFFKNRIPIYQKDPVLFAKEVCNFVPDEWQEKVLNDLAKHDKVSVRSGHGVGKSCVEAIALLWFLSCHKYPKVIATAPTRQQLNDVLWSEIDKWRAKSPLLCSLLTWTKTYVFMKGYEKRWFAVAKTASEPENMQGFHEDNMLVIVDEASGVADEIMEALLATLSGKNNKLLMCANPTRTNGTFYDSHNRDRGLYRCHRVSSLDSTRTNKQNIATFMKKYGEHSNVVRVRVFGDFPEQEDDVFLSLPLIEQTVRNEIEDNTKIDRITFGVDVARYGDDETVIGRIVGPQYDMPVVRHGQNLMRTVGDVVMLYKETIELYPEYKGVITINVDDTGLGGGVTDRLEEVKIEQKLRRMEIVPVNFASRVPKDGEENYQNITSYMWAIIKELMISRSIKITDDEELIAQLSVRKYSVTSAGKIMLEPKDKMKERGIKSPDRADALALACFTQNKVYGSFIEQSETVIIPTEAVKSMIVSQVNIGISTTVSGTSIIATAIIGEHKKAVVLKAKKYKGEVETNTLGIEFKDFVLSIQNMFGRVDYVYCDKKEKFLYRCIKESSDLFNLDVDVRLAVDDDVNNRIRLTTHLMGQNRLFLTEECDVLAKAFTTALWAERSNTSQRSESSDIGTLSAFEYTLERESSRFLQT